MASDTEYPPIPEMWFKVRYTVLQMWDQEIKEGHRPHPKYVNALPTIVHVSIKDTPSVDIKLKLIVFYYDQYHKIAAGYYDDAPGKVVELERVDFSI